VSVVCKVTSHHLVVLVSNDPSVHSSRIKHSDTHYNFSGSNAACQKLNILLNNEK